MAYTSGFTAVTGATFLASQYNTYVRDNLSALWVFTTAGDLIYATSSTTAARLGIGSSNDILRTTGGVPAWVSLVNLLQAAPMVASQATADLFYASSSTAIARLAKGTALQYLRLNAGNTAPEWATLPANELPTIVNAFQGLRINSAVSGVEWTAMMNVIRRQGGSVTNWASPGTSNRTVASAAAEMGAINIAISGGIGNTVVTFPNAFANIPLVFCAFGTNYGGYAFAGASSVTTTQFNLDCVGAYDGTLQVNWLAIGQPA